MASEAQVSANRRNAAKSTGPRTVVGKAVVAQNAIRHGLLACQSVIMGEDLQEFDLHRGQLLDELQPVGKMETLLAEQIVSLTWRLRRAERLQNEVFDSLLAEELESLMSGFLDELTPKDEVRLTSDPSTDPSFAVGRTVVRDFSGEGVLDRLLMYERRIESSLYRAMNELQKLRLVRELGTDDETPARKEGTADSAKQSQLEEVSSVKFEVSGDGLETASDAAEQNQAADNPHGQQVAPPTPGGTPMEAPTVGLRTQGEDDLSCETKPNPGTALMQEPTMEPPLAGTA